MEYDIVSDKEADKNLRLQVENVLEEGVGKIDLKLSENPCLYQKGCKVQVTAK